MFVAVFCTLIAWIIESGYHHRRLGRIPVADQLDIFLFFFFSVSDITGKQTTGCVRGSVNRRNDLTRELVTTRCL